MNPDIKRRWVEALRGGKYKQTTGKLKETSGVGHCCLGVLCEIAAEDGIGYWSGVRDRAYDGLRFITPNDSAADVLPPTVAEWAGFDITGPEVYFPNPDYIPEVHDLEDEFIPRELTDLNDSHTPFDTIAKYIEESL